MFLFFPQTAPAARWRFNKPAAQAYLDGASGIRVDAAHGRARFQAVTAAALPAPSGGAALAALDRTPRGGAEARPGAGMPPDQWRTIVEALAPTPERPFYTLRPQSGGWVELHHFDQPRDPPRTEPHMRVWPVAPHAIPPAAVARDYPDAVRDAARVLREAARRAGRRGPEVEAAAQLMRDFEALVREVRPDLVMPPIDVATMRAAAEGLLGLVAHVEHAASSGTRDPGPTNGPSAPRPPPAR